jgi:hypothetical protein
MQSLDAAAKEAGIINRKKFGIDIEIEYFRKLVSGSVTLMNSFNHLQTT